MQKLTLRIIVAGFLLLSLTFHAQSEPLILKLNRDTQNYIFLENYKGCELNDLIKLSPAADLEKSYTSIDYGKLVSNFPAFAHFLDKEYSKLELRVGLENEEDIIYFGADSNGNCVEKSVDRKQAVKKSSYHTTIMSNYDNFKKWGLISENGKLRKLINNKTKNGQATGLWTQRGAENHEYYMIIAYKNIAPKEDEMRQDGFEPIEIIFDGVIDKNTQIRIKPKF